MSVSHILRVQCVYRLYAVRKRHVLDVFSHILRLESVADPCLL